MGIAAWAYAQSMHFMLDGWMTQQHVHIDINKYNISDRDRFTFIIKMNLRIYKTLQRGFVKCFIRFFACTGVLEIKIH